jgi:hypothetical protein
LRNDKESEGQSTREEEKRREEDGEAVLLSHLSNLLYGGVCELHNLVHYCGLVLDTETHRERGGGREKIERGERK